MFIINREQNKFETSVFTRENLDNITDANDFLFLLISEVVFSAIVEIYPRIGTAVETGQQHDDGKNWTWGTERQKYVNKLSYSIQKRSLFLQGSGLRSNRSLKTNQKHVALEATNQPCVGALLGLHADHKCTTKNGLQHNVYAIIITKVIFTVLSIALDTPFVPVRPD